jgi:hypothetical protein
MMTDDEVVRQQLIALLRGGNAHLNFDRAVNQFPFDYINRKTLPISYSPWGLLEHMRICQWDILEFIYNPEYKSPPWPKGYWPAQGEFADEEKWQKTLSEFRRDLSSVEKLVNDPDTNLYQPIPHAPDFNIFREILLIADHNAYHLGEMVVLRKVLSIWPYS